MAGEEKSIRLSKDALRRLREARRTKVRYGRATLTVDRAVAVWGTPIGEVLASYRREEADAEEVAWRFLREQAVTHSPTFDWENVILEKLLPRVIAAMREPKLEAGNPEELIAELERIEAIQFKAHEKMTEQIQKLVNPVFPTPGYLKIMERSQRDMRLLTQQNQILKRYDEMLRPLRVQEQFATRHQRQLEQLQKALLPRINLDAFGLTQKRMQELLGLNLAKNFPELNLSKNFPELAGIKNPFLDQDWRPIFEQVAEAAREADVPEVAEAVEATASEAEKDDQDVDLDAFREAIEGLTKQLEESNRLNLERAEREEAGAPSSDEPPSDKTFQQQLFLQMALMLIRWMLEAFFIRLGLPLPAEIGDDPKPPEPPDIQPPDSLA